MFAQLLFVVAGIVGEIEPLVIQSAEEKFSTEVSKAESDLAKVRKAAGVARLKAYKDRLAEFTKAGDFDKATATKARIEQLESEPEAEPAKSAKRPRPKDTVKFQGHTYALIKEPATWHVAKQRCEEMGGHLVILESAKEADFVAKLCGTNVAFAGATDEAVEGEWRWVNGTRWTPEPGSVDNAENAEHVLAWGGAGNRWNDARGDQRQFYVCEWGN